MRGAQSIKGRLSLVFLFLFLLEIFLGLESLRSLSSVNDASAQIRSRWLPSTRALGDLNNFTTDFPAAETAIRRANGTAETDAVSRQMAELDRSIAAAEAAYRVIHHDPLEEALYQRFAADWARYRKIVDVHRSRPVGERDIPAAADDKASKSAYVQASNALAILTDLNVASAREAGERSERAYGQARRSVVMAILLAGVLVAGATLYVTRSISAPLVGLAARMRELASGKLDVEVMGAKRSDEVGAMARAVLVFRDNAVDLAQKRQALARQATMLQEKLAEEQRVALLERNFVSMASHEFRTPLAIIDGHAQRLISMRDRLTHAELAERTAKIRSAVQRMTQLIDNLLGSARMIDGRTAIRINLSEVDVTDLVREVCRQQREVSPAARIVERVPAEPSMVQGDPVLLGQVFANILSNAVKYSPDDGTIHVRMEPVRDAVSVVIEDQGIGIPEKDLSRIFERYYRGSNTSGIAGSGVGLYLARTIVDLHEGVILLDSREERGTRLEVRLRMARAAKDSTAVPPSDGNESACFPPSRAGIS
jgi:two-component system, OmpR family, sensor kinase